MTKSVRAQERTEETGQVRLISLMPETKLPPAIRDACDADFSDLLGECGDFFLLADSASSRDQALSGEHPLLILRRDMVAPPLSLLESTALAMEEFDAVVGPAFDGSLYALGVNEPDSLGEEMSVLVRRATTEIVSLRDATKTLSASGLTWYCLAPWYCAADAASRRFAGDHLQALCASGDDEFVAERCLRVFRAGAEGTLNQ